MGHDLLQNVFTKSTSLSLTIMDLTSTTNKSTILRNVHMTLPEDTVWESIGETW